MTELTDNILESLFDNLSDMDLDIDDCDLWYEVKTNPAVIEAVKVIATVAAEEAEALRELKLNEKTELIELRFIDEVLPYVREQYESDGIPDRPARREAFSNFVDMLNQSGELTDYEAENIDIDTDWL
tara:strand:- start:634 stop:1017 length:384 start_codon:yes stop_codon:yes gene_type:complete